MNKFRYRPKKYNENIIKLKKLSVELNTIIEDGTFYDLSFYKRYKRVREVKQVYNRLIGSISENKLKQAVAYASVLFLINSSQGCSNSHDNFATVTLDLGLNKNKRVEQIASKSTAPSFVNDINLIISADDMETIEEKIPLDTGILTLEVPAGNSRLFTVQAETVSDAFYSGSAVADIPAGDSVSIPITLIINDSSAPSASINLTVSSEDPTNSVPISFDIVFSEPINPDTLTTDDIVQNGTASGITWNIENSGDDRRFTLTATNIEIEGTVIPSIAADSVQDFGSNNNTVSSSTENTITYDITEPDVTINQATSQAAYTNAFPISFDVAFDESIDPDSFTDSDITQTGTATGVSWTIVNSGDNQNFTLTADSATGPGTIVPIINAGAVLDLAGNNNNLSGSTNNSVIYETTGPTVTINQAAGQADISRNKSINFDIAFSEPIDMESFTTIDIIQNGDATVDSWNITNSGDDQNFTLSPADVTGDGKTVRPVIEAGTVTDPAGNTNEASTSTDNEVIYDPPSFVYGGMNPFQINNAGAGSNPEFVDIDNDGDFDLFITNNFNATSFQENIGNSIDATFDNMVSDPFNLKQNYRQKVFVDIDGDGDYDVYATSNDGSYPILTYTNSGTVFIPDLTGDAVLAPITPDITPDSDSRFMDFVDIDNDSDYDLFTGGKYTGPAHDLLFFENIGTANSANFDSSAAKPPGLDLSSYEGISPTFVDIDDDGDFDLFVSTIFKNAMNDYDNEISFFENIGTADSPDFANPIKNPFGLSMLGNGMGDRRLYNPAFVDIDNDGDYDLFVSNYDGSLVFYENKN